MVELVRVLGWTYVSVVYEESSYGMQVTLILKKSLKLNHRKQSLFIIEMKNLVEYFAWSACFNETMSYIRVLTN